MPSKTRQRTIGLVLVDGTALADNFTNPRAVARMPKVLLRVQGEGIDKVTKFVKIKHGGRWLYAGVATGTLYDCASGACLGSSRLRVSEP